MIHEARQVKTITKINVLKQRPRLLIIGTVFTLLAIFFVMMFSLIITGIESGTRQVDYESINADGKLDSATIIRIETQYNVTINDEHPSLITYTYPDGENQIESKFRTLAPDRVSKLKEGDKVQIKYLGKDSIIIGYEQFSFPMEIVYAVCAVFFIIGFSQLLYLFVVARRELNLYKYGKVMDAELISITPKSSLSISRFGQGLNVHYQYTTSRGEQVLSKTLSSDYVILNEKKRGDRIKIFLSPDNESISCLVPVLEAVRNNWKLE